MAYGAEVGSQAQPRIKFSQGAQTQPKRPAPPSDSNTPGRQQPVPLYSCAPLALQSLAQPEPATEPEKISSELEDYLAAEVACTPQELRAFYARFMILASLPHRDPGAIPVWQRSCGSFHLALRPGAAISEPANGLTFGFPYGVIPRYLMMFVSTEVRKKKSPHIDLGSNLSQALHNLGLEVRGGTRGTIKSFQSQLWRFFSSQFIAYMDHEINDKSLTQMRLFNIADEIVFWQNPWTEESDERQGYVLLTEPFFKEILNHPVPFNPVFLRNIQKLPATHGKQHRGSSFLIDLYLWLTYRMYYLDKPQTISWAALQLQFGTSFSRLRDFKAFFVDSFLLVLRWYPEARATYDDKGLTLYPSPPALHPKKERAALP